MNSETNKPADMPVNIEPVNTGKAKINKIPQVVIGYAVGIAIMAVIWLIMRSV